MARVGSTDGTRELLELTASLAAEFLATIHGRPVFPDVMCEGDAGLRARLKALLAAHEQPDT